MLKKVDVSDLRMGMYIHELCGSWMEHPFWKTRFVLRDPEDLKRVVDSGIKEVWIDTERGFDVGAERLVKADSATQVEEEIDQALSKAENAGQLFPPRVSFEEEVHRAAKVCAKARSAMLIMFKEARMGKVTSSETAADLVEDISASVLRNPGALISLARLKSADDYTYMHSVAVCALMVALARQLNQDENLIRELGMAGLLHDLGKALMPMEILNKPGKLTDEEFIIIKTHPVRGYELLLEGGAAGEIALDVCLHHHEKTDGSGYPDKLKDEQISLFAKMGAVCDVYDAVTSNRPYKNGWDPAESIRKMTEWSKGHFDEHVFQAFVRSVGIYPVGSLVRLESGRLGVIMEQSDKSLLKPLVKAFFSIKSQTYIKPELIDLARPSATDKIVSREDPIKWGLHHVNQFLHSGVDSQ